MIGLRNNLIGTIHVVLNWSNLFKQIFLFLFLIFYGQLQCNEISDKYSNITVIKSGNDVYLRTYYDVSRDLVQVLNVFDKAEIGDNNPFNFNGTYLIPNSNSNSLPALLSNYVYIHNTSDDSTPYFFNGNRSGANHGFGDMRVVTCTAHDKTVLDVGSEWIDDANVKWYLLRVVNDSTLWLLSENIGTGDLWNFVTTITGNLIHSQNAIHTSSIIIESYTSGQLEPSVSNQLKKAFLNGSNEIISDGVYSCDSLKIQDYFWIPDLSESLDSVIVRSGSSTQPQLNLGSCHMEIKLDFNFDKYGGCSLSSNILAHKDIIAPFWGNIQSYCLNKGKYDSLYVYMPNVKELSDGVKLWDLKNLSCINIAPNNSLNYYKTTWEDPETPPFRMIQYLGKSKDSLDIGFAHGYSQINGDSRPEIRKNNITLAWTMAYTKKSYPYNIYIAVVKPAGFVQKTIAYRCYFNPKAFSNNATDVYFYKENSDYILCCDYNDIAINDTINLPAELNNKYVEIIDKNSNIEIITSYINASRIVVNSTGSYSYAVIKLSDFMPPDSINITYDADCVLLNWSASIGADYYRVFRSTNPYTGFEEIDTSTITSYTDTGILESTKYFYKVTAVISE